MRDLAKCRFHTRNQNRRLRIGTGWRQVVVDCGGICVMCGETEGLEFHDLFEEKNGNGSKHIRMHQYVLLCLKCHQGEHLQEGWRVATNRPVSQLMKDVDYEVWCSGGYKAWVERFGLEDRFGVLLEGYME